MPPAEITDETVREASSSIKDRWGFALIDIVEKTPDYRGGIVSHWSINKSYANALARRGLVTRHTVPHVGHKVTELGLAVYARMRRG